MITDQPGDRVQSIALCFLLCAFDDRRSDTSMIDLYFGHLSWLASVIVSAHCHLNESMRYCNGRASAQLHLMFGFELCIVSNNSEPKSE